MITAKEKKIIQKTLGTHYTGPIQKYLNSIGFYNTKGNPFSKQSIRNIVNGRPDKRMENAIMELVITTQERTKKATKERIELLERMTTNQ